MAQTPHFLSALVSSPSPTATMVIAGSGRPLATTLEPAFTSETRNRGLLGRPGLAPGHALIIAPSNSIHTFFMKFPIDVIYVDREGRVLKIRPAVGAWRISFCLGAFAVIEMAAGSAREAALTAGDRLSVEAREIG